MPNYYGDVNDIIMTSGANPQNFGLQDDDNQTAEEKLRKLVEKWARAARSYIEAETGGNFGDNPPEAIVNISERITINLIGYAMQRKNSPVIKSDNFNVQLVEDRIINDAIRKDLARFKPEDAGSNFSLSISNRLTRMEDEET